MKYLFRLLLFCTVLFLSGCFCFKGFKVDSSVRTLTSYYRFNICDYFSDEGRQYQINGYYGFPRSLENDYTKFYLDNPDDEYSFTTSGIFGIRMEKYDNSFISPWNILGIGVDLSQANEHFTFKNMANGNSYTNKLIFTHHRTLLSANIMTLVSGRIIGYITMQGGADFIKKDFLSTNPDFLFSAPFDPIRFDYRLGYGLQFYTKYLLGITIEGGYDAGAYLRAGLCYWVF